MGIVNWDEVWNSTRQKRQEIDCNKICSFGIRPLDEPLIGIMKKDFIVIGADSGSGKSEVCLKIALHNASRGKKVALYFIEGGAEEAMYRMQWKLICDMYYKSGQTGVEMDYRKWRMNMIKDDILLDIQDACFVNLQKDIGDNLKLYAFDSSFTVEDLKQSLGAFLKPPCEEQKDDLLSYKMDVDLIIIDHLQYFTLMNPRDEISETGSILKIINDISIYNEIPVILVSHLRKKDKDRGLPNQEDFYGTSNIAKISSLSITLSSGASDKSNPYIYPTFFRFVKTRTKINPNFGLLCDFNLSEGCYSEKYQMYYLVNDVPKGDPLKNHQLPVWAKGARTDANSVPNS
jgi:hypothetical protein